MLAQINSDARRMPAKSPAMLVRILADAKVAHKSGPNIDPVEKESDCNYVYGSFKMGDC